LSDLEGILTDLMKQAKKDESSRLAEHVQLAVVKTLRTKYGKIKNKGVKQAPFYVLLGAEMPSILVEVAFITNPRECRRLNSAGFQEAVADAIVAGIESYIKEIDETRIPFKTSSVEGSRLLESAKLAVLNLKNSAWRPQTV
jgi:N-acetylmuramoyl-L-alanine amidase